MGRNEQPGARMSIMSALCIRQAAAGEPRGKMVPARGASKEGRDRLQTSENSDADSPAIFTGGSGAVMALAVLLGFGHAAHGEPVTLALPSGQVLEFQEALREAPGQQDGAGEVYRFRFVAHQIAPDAGGLSFDDVLEDMQVLCQSYALPRLQGLEGTPERVVISLSERAVEFGTSAPDLTQYFEAYAIEDGRCIWEMY